MIAAETVDRCPECGGRIKGFTANAIRQCTHEWHFTPAGLTDREYRALYRLVRAGEGEGLATAQTPSGLRDRFRRVLADHGRVSIDDLDQVIEDLIEAVTE